MRWPLESGKSGHFVYSSTGGLLLFDGRDDFAALPATDC